MNILIIEILAYLIATAFISLFIGWVLRGSFAKKQILNADAAWESRLSELQMRHKQDTQHLEDQVDQLDSESNQLAQHNDTIKASLRENELSVHKARADAIELNRKQANTLERLQRIIAQKDEELKLYKDKSAALGSNQVQTGKVRKNASPKTANQNTNTQNIANVQNNNTQAVGVTKAVSQPTDNTIAAESTEAKIASLSAKRAAWEAERQRLIKTMGDEQETIAVDPADLPTEPLDKTVKISQEQANILKKRQSRQREANDVETDKTQMIDDDQTMLLDEQNMSGDSAERSAKKIHKPSKDDR